MHQKSDYFFSVPQPLIAQHPLENRSASRLLLLQRHSGAIQDSSFNCLGKYLKPNDLLIFNDTKVIPARLYGHKEATGGAIQAIVERCLPEQRILCQLGFSKVPAIDSWICFKGGQQEYKAQVIERKDDLFVLQFEHNAPPEEAEEILQAIGSLPLPPYIRRSVDNADQERYQTVYARCLGSVAAPTAGLHFDETLMAELATAGIAQKYLTLHIGAGTFRPMRTTRLEDHKMHSEWCSINATTIAAIKNCQAKGGRVIAVGTTATRALEALGRNPEPTGWQGEVDLFIYPPYEFKVVDGIITNFHLPESTLLMLISAFAGYRSVMAAYKEAVQRRYRFFSYGDAMLILPEFDFCQG